MLRAVVGHVKVASRSVWIEHTHLHHRNLSVENRRLCARRLLDHSLPRQQIQFGSANRTCSFLPTRSVGFAMCKGFHEPPSRNRRAGRRGFWCAGMAANRLCLGRPQHSEDSASQDSSLLVPNGNRLYLAWNSCLAIDTTPFLISALL
jgi:hypothetical protein